MANNDPTHKNIPPPSQSDANPVIGAGMSQVPPVVPDSGVKRTSPNPLSVVGQTPIVYR